MSHIPPITRIEPSKGGWRLSWTDIWNYRDLLYFLVLRNIKILYKQTVLSFGWAILNPAWRIYLEAGFQTRMQTVAEPVTRYNLCDSNYFYFALKTHLFNQHFDR